MTILARADSSCRPRSILMGLIRAVALSALATGCLQATAAATDAGSEGSTTTKESGTSPLDGGGSSNHEAASAEGGSKDAGDATVIGTPDAPVTTDAAVVIPSCKGPTDAGLACASCDESMCAATTSAAVTACAAFYSCFQTCDCSDTSCVTGCQSMATAGCGTAYMALVTCQTQSCAAPCATPDAGAPKSDAPTATSLCKNPTPEELACDGCDEQKCASALSTAGTACTAFDTCYAKCDCTDSSCITACESDVTSSCTTALEAVQSCQSSHCASACTVTSSADGGTPTVPDCADPTSAETTRYEACSACDESMCQSDVQTAVASCAAYYACYAMCNCANGPFVCADECAADSNTACNAAIEALADCQETSCATPCAE